MMTIYSHHPTKLSAGVKLTLLLAVTAPAAPVPPPEKLLPADTLFVMTVPDFAKASQMYSRLPTSQVWADPAMKPFRDKFLSKLSDEFLTPLERELNLKFADYRDLPQGQVTLAATLDPAVSDPAKAVSVLLLIDAKEKSDQLKTNLSSLQKRAAEANQPIRAEKVRGRDFFVLAMSSNNVPKTLGKFFPPPLEKHELGEEEKPATDKPKSELVIGQIDSLLIAASSIPAVERLVARLEGGSVPSLAEQASFSANYQAMLRDAPFYGWINASALVNIVQKSISAPKSEDADADSFPPLDPAKIFSALGITSVRSLAFALRESDQGQLFQFLIGAPESSRQGIFKVLAGESKDASPPAFVPADVTKFQRWRIDGQKVWAALETILKELSPQSANGINFLLETANTAAREKDPGFDVRKNLIGNLGDDIITYERAPRSMSARDLSSPPAVFLLGSPNPEKLAAALQTMLVFLGSQGGPATERDFNGRKITTVPLPALPLPMQDSAPVRRTLSYSATAGYIAFSTDVAMLEEYLRNTESAGKPLRETPGLREASQKVTGPGTSLVGYENQTETLRIMVEGLRKDPNSATNVTALALLSGVPGFSTPEKSFRDWMDFSLLPSFDKISKYFHFSVGALNATTDGLEYKLFSPAPPQMTAK
jgi:hypothetical protein